MTPSFELSLQEGDVVHLDIGHSNEGVDCLLTGFFGPDFVLMPMQSVSRRTKQALPNRPSAYVWVKWKGRYLAQRGILMGGSVADQLVFRVTDTFRIGQRRAYSRVPGRYPVTITPIDGDGAAVAATTADVSAGGLRLAPLEAPRLAEHNEVVIDLDGQPITARAVVVRHDPAAIGMRYTAIDDGDRLRIAQIALAWHQEQMMQATKAFDGGAEQLLG